MRTRFPASRTGLPVLIAAVVLGVTATAGCRGPSAPAPAGSAAATTSPSVAASTDTARFADVAAAAGLGDFRYEIPGTRPINILQSMPGGCAFLDFDGDGNLDVLLISQRVALFRGDGRGRFNDVTAAVLPVLARGWWMGCAVGDYDNDGHDDLYLSAYRGGALLQNEGGKRFRDVSKAAGIPPQPWGSACSWGDYDNDGRLDLFVGNYLKFGPDSVQLCTIRTVKTSCSPMVYEAERGRLYRNEGGGRFRDVTTATGADAATGKVLGSLFLDADGSGRQSLYLANDEVPSDLLLNTGKGFKNVGESSGVGYMSSGQPYGGMGVDQGDLDGDGRLDLVIATFALEQKLVLLNQGGGLFQDRGDALGVAGPMLPYLTFGTKLFDYDNDGDLDLMYANGYIADNIAEYEPTRTYRQPTLLFRNEEGARFTDISKRAGPDLQKPLVGRGLATGDFDNDGRVDALVADAEGAPLLLRNETAETGRYLSVKLIGTKSNRNGYGARITVEAGGKHWERVCFADGSYLSSSDPRVHVGLGEAASATVSVRWPSGKKDTFRNLPADRRITLREGDPTVRGSATPENR